MTDLEREAEINEKVARKLGWTITGESGGLKAFRNFKETELSEQEYIPDYCHSIAAAWEIIESPKFLNGGIAKNIHGEWVCNWDKGGGNWITEVADTAPLAICLAFLALPKEKS